jgi:hypothetical protein
VSYGDNRLVHACPTERSPIHIALDPQQGFTDSKNVVLRIDPLSAVFLLDRQSQRAKVLVIMVVVVVPHIRNRSRITCEQGRTAKA